METLQGPVTNCQHTLDISGGGSDTHGHRRSTTTTYIALFRVNSRPIEFRTNRPSSVSDGDQVVVAGVTTRSNSLRAYALRNVTTGETTNAGLLGGIIALIIFPIFLGFFTFVGIMIFGRYALYGGIVLAAFVMVYLIRQVVLTQLAINAVRA